MFKLLIVEDDPTMREIMRNALAPQGYDCLAAASADEGWKQCLKAKPDLILLDVHLPDESGIALCRRFKAEPRLRHIPILIMTGEARSVESRVEGLEAGADGYLLKPFSLSELTLRIKGLLANAAKPSRP